MEKIPPSFPQQKKEKNKASKKQHQLKVVYISNPMRVETSPSEFRALVQELTGRDADDVPDPLKFPASPGVGAVGRSGGGGVPVGNKPESSDLSSEAAPAQGPDYVPELIENMPGTMPSNMWYD